MNRRCKLLLCLPWLIVLCRYRPTPQNLSYHFPTWSRALPPEIRKIRDNGTRVSLTCTEYLPSWIQTYLGLWDASKARIQRWPDNSTISTTSEDLVVTPGLPGPRTRSQGLSVNLPAISRRWASGYGTTVPVCLYYILFDSESDSSPGPTALRALKLALDVLFSFSGMILMTLHTPQIRSVSAVARFLTMFIAKPDILSYFCGYILQAVCIRVLRWTAHGNFVLQADIRETESRWWMYESFKGPILAPGHSIFMFTFYSRTLTGRIALEMKKKRRKHYVLLDVAISRMPRSEWEDWSGIFRWPGG